MPELPEVETIACDLKASLVGQVVTDAGFLNTAIREDCNRFDPAMLAGKRLDDVSRRGKNLIFRFESGLAMVCHLKMTGRLIVDSELTDQNKHLHFTMTLDKSRLNFYDVRKFGRICITDEAGLTTHPRLSKLGPEPLTINVDDFIARIKKRNKAIKLILMDQEVIAGIGNIYADESLFAARIRPTARPNRLTKARLIGLRQAIVKVLNIAINNRGTSVDDYLDGHGQKGNFQNLIKVYGKTGQPCPECGGAIKRIVLGGRSTHYCPKCQK
jgi:formamidopyrimidine-DNA glycosylase